MAHFRAVIKGQRGEASRLGSKVSGISASVDGWNSGVSVYATVHSDGNDVFGIYATGGSNAAQHEEFIGTVTVRDGKAVFIPAREETVPSTYASVDHRHNYAPNYCTECGLANPELADDPDAYCQHCGAQWPENDTPCPNCGRPPIASIATGN